MTTTTSFETLGLSQYLLNTLTETGFTTPTPIQAKAIPLALEGRDIIGLAQTGTGKTLGFGLPIIARLIKEGVKAEPKACRALILAPTRELVNQIGESIKVFTRKSPLKQTSVVGGASINVQSKILEKGVDILIATPGRLLDLCNRRALNLSAVRYLVLDEADQMMDLGFVHDLKKIVKLVPKRRQTMLFSATMPQAIAELAGDYLHDPEEVSVTPPGKAADKVVQKVHFVLGRDHKTALLKEELRANGKDALNLVFCKTKHGAEKLMKHLDQTGFSVASIHGNKSQGQRDRALKGFRDGDIRTLVATDVAARGIDVPGVSHVYNYDLPTVADTYVHRIGRTARAGREGIAIAFCAPDELKMLYDIEKLMGQPVPVASGERPEWQGKKKGGGESHRGRRPESRAPREAREQASERREQAIARGSFAEVTEIEPNDGERPARKPRAQDGQRNERGPRRDRPQRQPRSSFSEVEELNGGEFRPVRDRSEVTGERPARGDRRPEGKRDHEGRPARQGQNGERRPEGRGPRPENRGPRPEGDNRGPRRDAKPAPGASRHSPARFAGYAEDANLLTEERPQQRDRRPHGDARPEGAKPHQGAKRDGRPNGGRPNRAKGQSRG
ncbi:DEAD/DEAH box helicase [Rhizobium sp. TRM95796]|uniref:DEAD/DEAH box helicase n=1 Tax=Rhizobium sp. TRM95796 TaxID=2979862 RepID=UPI0021E8B0F9|nr:DEAD/DEAH box helicase [Rhizobium sp. TRM95796]MCV3764940.1 DEAD/DEAH box helicase [Rhizobium sp. TRM95796]